MPEETVQDLKEIERKMAHEERTLKRRWQKGVHWFGFVFFLALAVFLAWPSAKQPNGITWGSILTIVGAVIWLILAIDELRQALKKGE